MRRIVPIRVHAWLLLTATVGLFGCPLLLDDHFSVVALSEPDAADECTLEGCEPAWNEVGGSAGAGGDGGFGGSSDSSGGDAGASTMGGTSSGAGGAAGAGGSSVEPDAGAACRTIEVSSTTYPSGSNCIGVHGSSNAVVDTGTTLELGYDAGDPCFTGTIASTGWGAVYELTFAGDDDGDSVWDAVSAGVTGFEFAYRGDVQPSSLRVIYKDPSGVDNCHVIGPGTTAVPFSAAHPDCDGSGPSVDADRLVEMILAFPVRSQPYDVEFCVQIRALD